MTEKQIILGILVIGGLILIYQLFFKKKTPSNTDYQDNNNPNSDNQNFTRVERPTNIGSNISHPSKIVIPPSSGGGAGTGGASMKVNNAPTNNPMA